ncbi:MAG: cyclic nucleotide-binding domain-containing protein [bacterium]|nr:cyclic nucleotide-binding domain-containing protein [bacterium]
MDETKSIYDDLRSTDLFKGLERDGLSEAVSQLTRRIFTAGETVIHRGDPGDSLFVILRGTAAVVLTNAEGWEYQVATLTDGELFGEMALLTGEPRSASVRAITDLLTIEIHQDQFQDLVAVEPELNHRLFRLLAARLGQTTVRQQAEHRQSREVIASLLSERDPPPVDHFPGRTKWASEIDESITRIAAGDGHLLAVGEAGTGKTFVGKLIHYRQSGEGRPLFTLDCASPPPLQREEQVSRDGGPVNTLTEIAQEAALFGHEADSSAHAAGTRRGYIEVADGGTLILKNVHSLSRRAQRLLLAYLRTGYFNRAGNTEQRRSRERIIACTPHDLRAADCDFNLDLLAELSGETVRLRPLKDRKQDIPVIAEIMLGYFARKAGREIHGFSQEALHALVDHDWPLNVNGLRHVIEQAVAICDGPEITDEHVLIDIVPFSAKGAINLLRVGWVRQLASKEWFPGALRYVSAPVFVGMALYMLYGPQEANLGNMFVWTIGWPGLVLLSLLGARSWCSYCPLPPISNVAAALTIRKVRTPQLVRRYGIYVGLVGLVVIIWAEHATQMFHRSSATGVLMLSILAGAVVSALAFGRRVWCQHFCPLGQIVAQYASISPLRLRTNSNVCLSQCRTPDCVKDNNCPMGLHPSSNATNHDCIMCLACVRTCTHRAVRLDLRAPWRGLLDQHKWDTARALFPVVLAAAVLALKLPPWLAARGVGATWVAFTPHPVVAGASILTFLTFSLGYVLLVLAASAVGERKGLWGWVSHIGYAYIPLALAGFFNLYFRELVTQGPEVLPTLVDLLGLEATVPQGWVTPELGTLKAVTPLVTIGSLVASLLLLDRIGGKCGLPTLVRRAHQLILAASALLFAQLL